MDWTLLPADYTIPLKPIPSSDDFVYYMGGAKIESSYKMGVSNDRFFVWDYINFFGVVDHLKLVEATCTVKITVENKSWHYLEYACADEQVFWRGYLSSFSQPIAGMPLVHDLLCYHTVECPRGVRLDLCWEYMPTSEYQIDLYLVFERKK